MSGIISEGPGNGHPTRWHVACSCQFQVSNLTTREAAVDVLAWHEGFPLWPYVRQPEPEAVRHNALMNCITKLWPERPPLSVRLQAAKAADAIVQDWFQR